MVAYRYRFVFLVGCAIDPFVALLVVQVEVLVEVVAYRYRLFPLWVARSTPVWPCWSNWSHVGRDEQLWILINAPWY